jgi:hypothetical protein
MHAAVLLHKRGIVHQIQYEAKALAHGVLFRRMRGTMIAKARQIMKHSAGTIIA